MEKLEERLRIDVSGIRPEDLKDLIGDVEASIAELEGESWSGTRLGNSRLMLGQHGTWAINWRDEYHAALSLQSYTPAQEYEGEPKLPGEGEKRERPAPLLSIEARALGDLAQLKISYREQATSLGEDLLRGIADKSPQMGDAINTFLGTGSGVEEKHPDSGHYAFGPEDRREIAEAFRIARRRGEVLNKTSWADGKYDISLPTLNNYLEEWPDAGKT